MLMKRHIWHGIKMVLVLAFIGFVFWVIKPDCPKQAYGQIEEAVAGLSDQSVKGDHVDSTSEDFVFNDAFRIKSSTDDSMFMTKKYIDDAAGGLVAQSVKGDHVDSTDEDFVFNDAFRITSTQAESIFITKNHVEKVIHDTMFANTPGYSTNSEIHDSLYADTLTKSFVIQDPATTHDFPFWMTPRAITLIACNGVCISGTNVVGCLMEYDNDAANPVVCNSSDWTFTTGEERTTSLSNASIDAGDYLGWKTTSVSGEVGFVTITIEYVRQ